MKAKKPLKQVREKQCAYILPIVDLEDEIDGLAKSRFQLIVRNTKRTVISRQCLVNCLVGRSDKRKEKRCEVRPVRCKLLTLEHNQTH